MTTHKTGTREQWLAARLELLKAEKELTRRSDELARQFPPRYFSGPVRHLKLGQCARPLALLTKVVSRIIRRWPLFTPRKGVFDIHILCSAALPPKLSISYPTAQFRS
jgi:Bacterial protein of unknown function (DUF899)